MSTFTHPAFLHGLLFAAAVVAGGAVDAAAAPNISAVESRCAQRTSRAAVHLGGRWLRERLECRLGELMNPGSGLCASVPSAEALSSQNRLFVRAQKYCFSSCSVSSEIECIADEMCPPLPANGAVERCTAGAKNRPFDAHRLGFPGPFCEAALESPIQSSTDIAACMDELTRQAAETAVEALFGSIDLGPPPAPAALRCLAKAANRVRRTIRVVHARVTKCRIAILRGARSGNPVHCAHEDSGAAVAIANAIERLRSALFARCSDAEIAQLDLCGAGVGGTTSVEQAADCLTEVALEIADSPAPPVLREYSAVSLIDAAFPPQPSCGDGKVNQSPNAFLLLGEECDGDDDAACPGQCLPPGTPFECTCADVARMRFVALENESDLDHGWTGIAQDALLPAGAGFTMDLSDCDCSEMDGALCTGVSGDSVCTIGGMHGPRCSWDPGGAVGCDAHGDMDGRHENADCFVCDAFSLNAGDSCEDSADCVGRCYDSGGAPQAPCPGGQGDCAIDEVCRGRCDTMQMCTVLPLTPPAPVAGGGTTICIVQTLTDDISGTFDVVSGEHAMTQKTNVKVYLGLSASVPCPVCGGVCAGGSFSGDVCRGTCSGSLAPCRFDDECPGGEFCSSASPECAGGYCDLRLVCHGGADAGAPCRIESSTELFGTVSNDCRPSGATNLTGEGVAIAYAPVTSEPVSLPSTVPCTSLGFELFDCPCPDDGGQPTRPNQCEPACNAGAEYGIGCANGNESSGEFTACAGGSKAGRACDEDGDCPGSSCSANPFHCTGDPAFERNACSSDAQCGSGTCVDACPSGRCVPLCVADPSDPEDGICSAGPPIYHCNGTKERFRTCSRTEAEGSCTATCSGAATPCASHDECPFGETCVGACELSRLCEAGIDGVLGNSDDIVGAGICVSDLPTCLPAPLTAEGGDIFNGRGSPNEPLSTSVFCIDRTSSIGADAVIGVGGPGRIRRRGLHVTNDFASLP